MAQTIAAAEQLTEGLAALTRAVRSTAHRMDRDPHNARRSQLQLLHWLSRAGESRCSDLAHDLGVNASVVSRQLATLEAANLVCRRGDPRDARAQLVRISPLGSRRLAETYRHYAEYVRRILADWEDPELVTAAAILVRLADSLSNVDDRGPSDPLLEEVRA